MLTLFYDSYFKIFNYILNELQNNGIKSTKHQAYI